MDAPLSPVSGAGMNRRGGVRIVTGLAERRLDAHGAHDSGP